MKLIDLDNLQFYDSKIKAYFQQKIEESFNDYEVIIQKDSLNSFPETGNEKTIYINTSTNEAYRWSDQYKRYYPIGINWHFVETSYEHYLELTEKSENTLYFLTNGQLYKGNELISNVRLIQNDFPDVIDSSLLGNFCVSLKTGEIRYAGADGYTNLSELMTQNIVLSEKNLKTLVEKIAKKQTITMPKLEVDGDVVIWIPSNVEEIDVLVPQF